MCCRCVLCAGLPKATWLTLLSDNNNNDNNKSNLATIDYHRTRDVAKLLDTLDDNSLVIIVADHGKTIFFFPQCSDILF